MLNPELLMRGDDQKTKNTSYSNLGTLSKRQMKKQENALSDYYSFKD